MPTECRRDRFGFEAVEGRQVVAAFDGGQMTWPQCIIGTPLYSVVGENRTGRLVGILLLAERPRGAS